MIMIYFVFNNYCIQRNCNEEKQGKEIIKILRNSDYQDIVFTHNSEILAKIKQNNPC